MESGERGRGAKGRAGLEEITGCEENRLGAGRASREWALTWIRSRWGKRSLGRWHELENYSMLGMDWVREGQRAFRRTGEI